MIKKRQSRYKKRKKAEIIFGRQKMKKFKNIKIRITKLKIQWKKIFESSKIPKKIWFEKFGQFFFFETNFF
jgi:hypothetical protein